jgi:hypothetical protein
MNSDFCGARCRAAKLEAILYMCCRVARQKNHGKLSLRVNTTLAILVICILQAFLVKATKHSLKKVFLCN